jgi:Ca2+:H+ antiporter
MSRAKRRGFFGLVGAESGLIAGAIIAALFLTVGKTWLSDLDDLAWTGLMFVWLFGTMIWCAFGVVRHAEALAELLGEPYGTLILAITPVISMEVAVLATWAANQIRRCRAKPCSPFS